MNRIHELVEEAGAALFRAQRDGSYVAGYESKLAESVVAAIDPDDLDAALLALLKERMQEFIGVECLLDEEQASSYETTDALAAHLRTAIRAQGCVRNALYQATVREICDGADFNRFYTDLAAVTGTTF